MVHILALEIGEPLPSLRDSRLLEDDSGLKPWANICRSSGAALDWCTPPITPE
jgi:hypothetical protein